MELLKILGCGSRGPCGAVSGKALTPARRGRIDRTTEAKTKVDED